MSKSVVLKFVLEAFISTFNAQNYVNGISICQNYNKKRIWLVNEVKLNSICLQKFSLHLNLPDSILKMSMFLKGI